MATWNSRGLRGSILEDFVNRTNEKYLDNGLALIQKIPTPITPIKIDQEHRHITLAYFEQKSTVDYIGAVQGIPVCFDAKESAQDTFFIQFSIVQRRTVPPCNLSFFFYQFLKGSSNVCIDPCFQLMDGTIGCYFT